MEKVSIYGFCKKSNLNGFDICDKIFDWGNYFDIVLDSDIETDDDYYSKLMNLFAKGIELVKYQKDWFTICKVSEYIVKHIKAFNKFMNEANDEDYQPQNYEKISIDDEKFYDIYLATFQNLINGNYAEKDYKLLYELLTKRNN